jgi:voltage-dependent calcium channel
LLFAIIGVQAFKSSLRRNCIWFDDNGNNFTNQGQYCGGYLQNGQAMPWLLPNLQNGTASKGYLCPEGSKCIQQTNPHNGTVSFDNIVQSLELVFVIMSSNTWSDIMYQLCDSDYLYVALFFAAGIVIMSLWLINLLIAVITSSFQVIREESKASAFTGQDSEPMHDEEPEDTPKPRLNPMRRLYEKTAWLWILVITYGLICQSLRSATMSNHRRTFIDVSETAVTLILLIEIIIRFIVDWRSFFQKKRNLVDTLLALITTIIQIPAIKAAHHGRAYNWLTAFQIMRIYRVVLAVPLTRNLIVRAIFY